MRATAKKTTKRSRVKQAGKRRSGTTSTHVIGRLQNGKVLLSRRVPWSNGQKVVVIALPPAVGSSSALAPPIELLEEDALEFARLPETLAAVNRSELE